jgi:hypothetical protein
LKNESLVEESVADLIGCDLGLIGFGLDPNLVIGDLETWQGFWGSVLLLHSLVGSPHAFTINSIIFQVKRNTYGLLHISYESSRGHSLYSPSCRRSKLGCPTSAL